MMSWRGLAYPAGHQGYCQGGHRLTVLARALLPTSRRHDHIRRQNSSCRAPTRHLTWHELDLASRLAKLSGYCYVPANQLQDIVKADGLELVAHGRTQYTAWYVADGFVDHGSLYSQVRKQMNGLLGHHQQQHRSEQGANQPTAVSAAAATAAVPVSTAASAPAAAAAVSVSASAPAPPPGLAEGVPCPAPQRTRFVFIRGVQWRAPDASMSTISQALLNFWPAAFPPAASSRSGSSTGSSNSELVSHSGITALAVDLYKQLSPYLDGAPAAAQGPGSPAATAAADGRERGQPTARPLAKQPGGTASVAPMTAGLNRQQHPQQRAQQQLQQTLQQQTQQKPHAQQQLEQLVQQQGEEQRERLPICIAGHSLGGSLGLLVMAQALLDKRVTPAHVTCHTFGSPPVLAHKDGGGGSRVLQVLGLPDNAGCSFVLENDPVPRALITADPAFNALKQYAPVRQVLEARGWLSAASEQALSTMMTGLSGLVGWAVSGTSSSSTSGSATQQAQQRDGSSGGGSSVPQQPAGPGIHAGNMQPGAGTMHDSAVGSSGVAGSSTMRGPSTAVQQQRADAPLTTPVLSPHRFVFENVGSVYFMRGGAELVPVGTPAEVEELLRLAVADFVASPARALQAWLDHHHISYAHDLEVAACALLKRQLRAAVQQQQHHTHHQHPHHPHPHQQGQHQQQQLQHRQHDQGPAAAAASSQHHLRQHHHLARAALQQAHAAAQQQRQQLVH